MVLKGRDRFGRDRFLQAVVLLWVFCASGREMVGGASVGSTKTR